MPAALLRSKFRTPDLPAHFVRRPRLHDLLDAIVSHPLTVVVAPAGSGKTTLLSGWAHESSVATSWLSLDESDLDLARFWYGVIVALQPLAPEWATSPGEWLADAHSIADVAGVLLANLPESSDEHAVLVIDDAHLTAEGPLTAHILIFVQQLPSWLH